MKKRSNCSPEEEARIRDLFLNVTIGLIAEVGEDAVSVSEVARRAGLTRTHFYYHFKTREALLEAVKEELDEQLLHAVDGSLMCRDPYSVIASFAAEEPDLMRLRVMKMIEEGASKDSFILYHKKVFRWHEKHGHLREGVDPDMAAIIVGTTLTSAVIAVSKATSLKQRRDIAHRYGQTYHRLLFHGVLDGVNFKHWPEPAVAG